MTNATFMFQTAVLLVSVAAGSLAAVAGFGIGSLLTPLLALEVGTKTAVAAVSVPHAIGTALRLLLLRRDVDRWLLWRFGVTSAAGGLAGALLHNWASSRALAIVFGALLVLAGATQFGGYAQRWRFRGRIAWIAGAVSGFFGGLVGNQGGIRSAAMLGFELKRDAFVATATAIAMFVDAARVPVYVAVARHDVFAIGQLVLLASIGVVAGTLGGARLLARVPERWFRRIVGAILLALGFWILVRGRA